jgi:hypothetical protein
LRGGASDPLKRERVSAASRVIPKCHLRQKVPGVLAGPDSLAATRQANSLDSAAIRFHKARNKSRGPGPAQSWSPRMWVLLLLPFIGLLWVPFYNSLEPALFGFPFFYWYQLAWVPISSLLIWLVYRSRTPDEAP